MPKALAAATLLLVVAAASSGADSPASPTRFLIEIETTSTGARLHCISGCAWITTSYTCGGAVERPCRFALDESGIRGVPVASPFPSEPRRADPP
jgi:hypothetical protein